MEGPGDSMRAYVIWSKILLLIGVIAKRVSNTTTFKARKERFFLHK